MSAGRSSSPALPALSPSDEVSVQNLLLLDSLGADTILRSSDSVEVRVPRLYIANFSPVLGALIQDATNSFVPPNAESPLPVVQLPESGATLISLLSFIFPLAPTLPSTSRIEETMDLLSAAQKYKMSSVLAHIRLILAQQDPPFIHKDNALRAYSLAQKNGLRQEAVNAARVILKKGRFLTLYDLEGESDIMPGAFLHELIMFHERFQTNFMSGLRDFRNSSLGTELKDLKCISRDTSGIPIWLEKYIGLYAILFFPFDFVALLEDWVLHLKHCECILLPEVFHEIWTDLNTVIDESMEKAGSDLSILGVETPLGSYIRSQVRSPTTPLSLPECMDVSQADVIVRSFDHVDFRVHKSILASSSPVFKDMFSLPQPSDDEALNEAVNGLPVVQLTEDAEIVQALITTLYPIPSELPTSYDRILALLAAAQKYDMGAVQSSIRAEASSRKLFPLDVFYTYAMSSSRRLIPEMNMAARLSLDFPMTFQSLGAELRLFEGWALCALNNFHMHYRDNLITCSQFFLDARTGPSKIWVACPGPRHPSCISDTFGQDLEHSPENSPGTRSPLIPQIEVDRPGASDAAPSVPAWLHDVLRAPEFCLFRSSSIRARYLSAMREHVTTDKCTFCLEVHAMEGENYILELERAVTRARDNITLEIP